MTAAVFHTDTFVAVESDTGWLAGLGLVIGSRLGVAASSFSLDWQQGTAQPARTADKRMMAVGSGLGRVAVDLVGWE